MDNTSVFSRSRRILGWVVLAMVATSTPAQAQPSLETFRIYLRDGRVLTSYGEYARVDDDLVFVVTQGQAGGVETRDLITVPVAKVDMDRTAEYARALRVAKYGSTRGENEYLELTADIARALAELEASTDQDRRLGIAQVARARLATWSEEHYGYRASELRQLVQLFDEVIVELQAASGISHFSLDLVANTPPSSEVPLFPALSSVESVEMALVAAAATEIGVEKMSLLQSASRVVATLTDAPDRLRADVARALAAETQVETAYRTLLRDAVARADVAVRAGRPAAVARVIADVKAGDARLGQLRSRDVAGVLRRLDAEVRLAAEQKAAFDRWAQVKDELHAYDTRVRIVLDGWASHASALSAIRDRRRAAPAALDAAYRRFGELDRALSALRPPDELRDVHGVFRSAFQMATQALQLGRRLAVAANADLARNASAAIAGAELLRAQGLTDLATGLAPRKVR
jgi:hypothetical protein